MGDERTGRGPYLALEGLDGPTRSFVALPCPPRLRAEARAAIAAWRALDADVRWADPAGLHLTLRFLGDAAPDALRRLAGGLARIAREARPVPWIPGPTGAFPGWRRPRVVWLGLDRPEPVARLAEGIERVAREAGFVPAKRPFSPHLTLGRVRGPRGVRRVIAAVRGWEPDSGREKVDTLTLFASRLGAGGARHTPLARYRLGEER